MTKSLPSTQGMPADGTTIAELNDENLDLFHRIHQKITSKNEEISKNYTNNIVIKFSDLKELHYKCLQCIHSLTQITDDSIGVRVVISHLAGQAEKFNSFDEFEKFNITSPNPTLTVEMQYRFSLWDIQSNSFESYIVRANSSSRLSEMEHMRSEFPSDLPTEFLTSLISRVSRVSVEYSDYVKARTFIAMYDEWIQGLHEFEESKVKRFLLPISRLLSSYGHLIIVFLLAIFTANSLEKNPLDEGLFLQFLIVYASMFVLIANIGKSLFSAFQRSILSMITLSYIELNKGDKKLVDKYIKESSRSKWTSAKSLLGAFLLGLSTNWTYDLVKSIL
jgi:hypothetical protein